MADIKRSLRRLKRLEIKLRGGSAPNAGQIRPLVWERFFGRAPLGAHYTPIALAAMDKYRYREVVQDYFAQLYFELYRHTGGAQQAGFDPELLAQMGLDFDADAQAIHERFRQLAKQHHPDAGGDAAQFIALMDRYRQLIQKGK